MSEQETITLPAITVTGERWDETSYNVPQAATATKAETPLMETPVSIQIVPQQVLNRGLELDIAGEIGPGAGS